MITDEQIKSFHDKLVFEPKYQIYFFSKKITGFGRHTSLSSIPIEAKALVDMYREIVKEVTGYDYKIDELRIRNNKCIGAGAMQKLFSYNTELHITSGLLATGDVRTVRGVMYHEAHHLTRMQKAFGGLVFIPYRLNFIAAVGSVILKPFMETASFSKPAAKTLLVLFMARIIVANVLERQSDDSSAVHEPEGMRRLSMLAWKQFPSHRSHILAAMAGYPSIGMRLRKAQQAIIQKRLKDKGFEMPKNPIWRAALKLETPKA